jgi:hypothetical protein
MKIKTLLIGITLCCLLGGAFNIFGQGTAFTYQGRLFDGTNPANGTYDVRASAWTAVSGGSMLSAYYTNPAVVVSNGLFTVLVDFGPGIFIGGTDWLEIDARTNGAVSFTALSPRQQLTPTPYAIFAEGANATGISGTIPAGDLGGTYGNPINFNNAGNSFTGNGSGLTGVNASLLGGLSASSFWQTTGNAGTTAGVNFVGTTDNQPLDLETFGSRGLQLQYTSRTSGGPFFFSQYGININGGYWGNTISNNVIGATIAGGGDLAGSFILPTSYANVVTNDFGTIGGGYANLAGLNSTIPGGYYNVAVGNGSFAAGRMAQTVNAGSFIWGDGTRTNTSFGANCFDVLATGGAHFLTGTPGVNVDQLNLNNYNDGLAHRDSLAGQSFYGSFLWGFDGGGLGTVLPDEVSLTWDYNGNVWVSNNLSTASLTVRGEYMVVNGLTPVYAYIGDDGAGSDVQIGSQRSGITAVAAYNTADNAYMHFYCSTITLEGGADLAEPFKITPKNDVVPEGAVVVIDDEHPGQLKMSDQAYDTRVAGVVSGANGINPGIQMEQQGVLEGGKNVALTGRVYVLADASNGAIRPGDMLTTSSSPGRAMKATDHSRASGAILGKAMTGLSDGKGMVLVLVTLQ